MELFDTIIQGLGYIFLTIILVIIYSTVKVAILARKNKNDNYMYREHAVKIADNLSSASDWIGYGQRKAFGELVEYIAYRLKEYGRVQGDDLRSKVDDIIIQYNLQQK